MPPGTHPWTYLITKCMGPNVCKYSVISSPILMLLDSVVIYFVPSAMETMLLNPWRVYSIWSFVGMSDAYEYNKMTRCAGRCAKC